MVVSSVVSISALSSEITASGEIGTVVPMSIPSEIFWNDHYGPYELYDPSDLNNPEAEMAYTEAFRTIFYEGGYYEEYTPDPNLITEIEWLLDCSVDVINISIELFSDMNGSPDSINSYGTITQYIDYIIYAYDVSIVKSAGNSGSSGIPSGGMAYNAIVVGNYNRYSGAIAGDSSYYSGSSLAYKPDISAPGYFTFTFSGEDSYGTSFAAPMVTGTIALIMSYRGSLKVNPTGIKSILTSSV